MARTRGPIELSPEHLRRTVDLSTLTFSTTDDVPPLTTTIGQPRAFDALAFGIGATTRGFNVFVSGAPGSGRESTVLDFVARIAQERPTPSDWIYVHNFTEPDRPVAIAMKPGAAREFARDMDKLVLAMQTEIPRAFEGEDVQRKRDALVNSVNEQKSSTLSALQAFAKEHEFILEMTPTGIVSYPAINGKPIEKDAFELLPDSARSRIEVNGAIVQESVGTALRQFRQLDKAAAEALQQLQRDVVTFVTSHLFEELRERYRSYQRIVEFLGQVEADVPDHLHDFWPANPAGDGQTAPELQIMQRNEHLARYDVNVFIDHGDAAGAPVVFERNPNFPNLLGRIDYRAVFGSMVTDFRQIKPGALHRANGGFLILPAADVLRNPFSWDTLKRALLAGAIEIENLGDQIAAVPTARLRPAPIPLDVKVILIGPPSLYALLFQLDEDFPELFSVKADFAPDMPWSEEHANDYAAFISRHVREHGLRHLDREAVATIIEEGARQREHQGKLTARFLDIANLVTESSYWAEQRGQAIVSVEDVNKAVAQRTYRANAIEERLQEFVEEGTIKIASDGARVGQVNGLAVLSSGDYAFGRPSRVSARVSVGRGAIHSIEREIELSGPIHSKGVLILSGYLQGQYGATRPLALSATLTFEQSYEEIEGDSASSTELYALLSALSRLPLDQGIAVTGSVNQHGEIQAVGGVNHKIEGFFAVCKQQGFTGRQGVMLPASNVRNLMLKHEVLDAVRDGKFHIWPVETIDEGIALLTGKPAGKPNKRGDYPAGSVHRLVTDRLSEFLNRLQALGGGENGAAVPPLKASARKPKPAPVPKSNGARKVTK